MSFSAAYRNICNSIRNAPIVKTERWQGRDVRSDPAAATREIQFMTFEVDLRGIEDLDHWREDIRPNLPWADEHFEERVCGSPLNPGKTWETWPWASSADKFRDKDKLFNITYAERLWPKYPRRGNGGDYGESNGSLRALPRITGSPMRGISGTEYGDLQDLVELLLQEPHTRQAYIPLFYPEETGKGDGGRKMCTLGYQFLVRDGRMSIWYPLRSCDLYHHFRDDCYLAVRLLLWVLDRCRERDTTNFWNRVVPGTYAMHCTSLHLFANDYIKMFGGEAK